MKENARLSLTLYSYKEDLKGFYEITVGEVVHYLKNVLTLGVVFFSLLPEGKIAFKSNEAGTGSELFCTRNKIGKSTK